MFIKKLIFWFVEFCFYEYCHFCLIKKLPTHHDWIEKFLDNHPLSFQWEKTLRGIIQIFILIFFKTIQFNSTETTEFQLKTKNYLEFKPLANTSHFHYSNHWKLPSSQILCDKTVTNDQIVSLNVMWVSEWVCNIYLIKEKLSF